jgi:hypothetical protein
MKTRIAQAKQLSRHLGLVTITALLGTSPFTFADGALTPFTAEYQANIKGFAVKASRELTNTADGQYILRFRADSWAASIDESATFSVQTERLLTNHYHYLQTTFGKKREHRLTFNAAEKTISSNDQDIVTVIPYGDDIVYDKLSYQLQLQLDLQNGKDNLHYTISDKGGLKAYNFAIENEEIIDTALGKLNTVKVKVIRKDSDKITYIWFAKDWHYLLTQLKQYENNKETFALALNTATVNSRVVTGVVTGVVTSVVTGVVTGSANNITTAQ